MIKETDRNPKTSAPAQHLDDTNEIFHSIVSNMGDAVGRDDPSVRQAALDAGAFGFLSKPFDDEALLQLVRKAVAG